MDDQTKKLLTDTVIELKNQSQGFQQIHQHRYNVLENNCYQKHRQDIDRFVSCIKYHSDQLDKYKKNSIFYQKHIQIQTTICFVKAEGDIMKIEKCRRDAKILLEDAMRRKLA